MQPFYQDYLERLTAMHREVLNSIDGLPSHALDWAPLPETNTIHILVAHLTGA